MMTPRNAMVQLGKLVARDLGKGRMSSGMQSVGDALSEAPDSLLTLLDVLLAEARKKRSSEALIAAYLFMMREVLQVIRIRMENGEADAEAIIARDQVAWPLGVGLASDARFGDVSKVQRHARQSGICAIPEPENQGRELASRDSPRA